MSQGKIFRALFFKWMETFFALPTPYIQSFSMAKAYILLQRETIRVGSSRWLRPPVLQFHVGNTNMLVSEKPCRPNAIPNLPNATPSVPNVSQWNTLCVGYARVGFARFVSFFFCVGYANSTQCEHGFQWNMGLRLQVSCVKATSPLFLPRPCQYG